ncbi:MAG: hypothetical protein PPHERAN_5539 [uncultured Paraburkholderia sp.]|nr:MAG: hypothetical protein PPHERAN_5539 [uncultured Paraburkholderia sp.]
MPDFRPPITEEMRELWNRHRDPDVWRLLLEIAHLRRVLTEIETLRAAIERTVVER